MFRVFSFLLAYGEYSAIRFNARYKHGSVAAITDGRDRIS